MRYQKLLISLATLAVAAAAPGCYNPDLKENPFLCGEVPNECPEGYLCHKKDPTNTATWVCRLELPPDMGIPDRMILNDAERLPYKDGSVYLDMAHLQPAPANCADYSSEPNNSGATATGLFQTGLINGWEICYPFDVDQYSIKLPANKKLTVKVIFKLSTGKNGGDLDAALVNTSDGFITAGRTVKDNETVTVTNATTSDEKYILGVWGAPKDGAGPPATNTYDIEIQVD